MSVGALQGSRSNKTGEGRQSKFATSCRNACMTFILQAYIADNFSAKWQAAKWPDSSSLRKVLRLYISLLQKDNAYGIDILSEDSTVMGHRPLKESFPF